jgi:hypothetical protein
MEWNYSSLMATQVFTQKVGFKNISPDIIKPPFKLSYPQGWLIQDLQNLQNLQNSNTKKTNSN